MPRVRAILWFLPHARFKVWPPAYRIADLLLVADLAYVSKDVRSVVMFENKIGSDIQYEPTPESNQLARQLEYLVTLSKSGREVVLILVSSRKLLGAGWYVTE